MSRRTPETMLKKRREDEKRRKRLDKIARRQAKRAADMKATT